MDSDSKTNKINRKALGTSSLMIATFLNPLGTYISLQINAINKRLLITMFVLYICAFLSFISSFISFKIGNKFGEYPNHICIIFKPFWL
jgi:hypothetical protein